MSELKPCPKCGSKADTIKLNIGGRRAWSAQCRFFGCVVGTKLYPSESQAVAAWNHIKPTPIGCVVSPLPEASVGHE